MTYPTKKVKNCIDKINEKKDSILKREYEEAGKYPVIDQGQDFIGGYTNKKENIYFDELPVVIFGDHTREVKFIDFPFATGADGTKILRPTEKLSPRFFYYMVKSLDIRDRGYGRHYKLLKEKEIPLPPLKTQKEIVAKLDEVFAKLDQSIALREAQLEDTDQLLPTTLREIFSEGKEEGWEEKKIEEICKKPQYGFTASAEQEKVGPQMLRITDIRGGAVNWNTVPYCEFDGDVEKYQLEPGDIVFARTGSVGNSYLIKEPPDNTIFASFLIRLQVEGEDMPEFLYYFFQSPQYWNQITEQKAGATRPNVNATKLRNMVVWVPPLVEQKKIVTRLDALSEKIKNLRESQTSQLEDLKNLKQAYLRKAFNGELV